jgi:hypothetical protein
MVVNRGPSSSEEPIERRPLAPHPDDHANAEARLALATDIRALNHLHVMQGWSVDEKTGELLVLCSCDRRIRPVSGPGNHWSDQLRRVRGLHNLPKPPKR